MPLASTRSSSLTTASLSAEVARDSVLPVKLLRAVGTTLENWKLLRPSVARVLTLRGWLLVLAFGAALAGGFIGTVYPFLAVTSRVEANALVVEGWVPDFAVRAGLDEFHRGRYRDLITTGGPLETGELLVSFGTHANVGRATLEKMGAPTTALHAVSAPKVKRDRTYSSAVALREWWRQRGAGPAAFNVVTTSAHARRTRLLFEKAFGADAQIGIIAVPDERFDGARWWTSSQGVRTVSDELIGYLYARFFSATADDLQQP